MTAGRIGDESKDVQDDRDDPGVRHLCRGQMGVVEVEQAETARRNRHGGLMKTKTKKCSSLRCEVCRSLKLDTDWRITAGGQLQRGSIRVDPEMGGIEQDGAPVPLWRLERVCVKRACRFRAEKRFAVYKFVPSEK